MLEKKNIRGFSKVLQPKVSKGKVLPIPSIRFWASEKLPLRSLDKRDIIPSSILDIPTDIMIGGDWRVNPPKKKVKVPVKTDRIRPLVAGISIGNMDITAGTHGWYYDKDNEVFGGTNAHVNCSNPSKEGSVEKRIVQPGTYDSGSENDIIGSYEWHKRIAPIGDTSNCEIAGLATKTLNGISKLFNRNTRFSTYVQITNKIDFGTFYIDEPYELKLIDFDSTGYLGVGHGFAGSDQTSILCKGSYIEEEGYNPVNTKFISVIEDDIVTKTGRTTCCNSAKVTDRSAVSQVNYGSFVAIFDDIIITDHLLDGGDSGSFVWTKEK